MKVPEAICSEAVLEIKELSYIYPDGTTALSGVNLVLEEGEKLALVGANGSGKSTLLLHLSGCIAAQKGQVFLRGSHIGANLRLLRESVGLIFQEPDDQLFMPSVLEDVAFGLVSRGMDVITAHEYAMETLRELSVTHLAHRPPHRLSGGEKRLVALAGILVMKPEIVVLDEPSAALDPRARRRVIEILNGINRSMILATHDLDMALDVCSRTLVMNGGCTVAYGKLPDLFKDGPLLIGNGLELPLKFSL